MGSMGHNEATTKAPQPYLTYIEAYIKHLGVNTVKNFTMVAVGVKK